MSSLRKDRKADQSAAAIIWQLCGMALAGIIILLLVTVGYRIWLTFTDKPDQGTLHSFTELADTIESLKDGDSRMVDYYIADGFKVIGFNFRQNYVEQTCHARDPPEPKPSKCGEDACLALCEEEKGKCRDNPKDSRVFKEIKSFAAQGLKSNAGKHISKSDERNFVVYGDCGFEDHKLQPIFIRRAGDKIIFSSFSSESYIEEVKKILTETLTTKIPPGYKIIDSRYKDTMKESLSLICDQNNGELKEISTIYGKGIYYEPKQGSDCIEGDSFGKRFDLLTGVILSKGSVRVEVTKDGTKILDYCQECKEEGLFPVSSEMNEGNINVKMTIYYTS